MASVLALGPFGFDVCRAAIADFLARHDRRARLIEVRVLNSVDVRIALNAWRPKEDEDPRGMAEQIASYIVGHQGAGATILVRHDV